MIERHTAATGSGTRPRLVPGERGLPHRRPLPDLARREGWGEAIPAPFAGAYGRFLAAPDEPLGHDAFLAGTFAATDSLVRPVDARLEGS